MKIVMLIAMLALGTPTHRDLPTQEVSPGQPRNLIIAVSTSKIGPMRRHRVQVVTARVTLDGVPQIGTTVTFTVERPDVATVSPATTTTDLDGVAETTVESKRRGRTLVTAAVNGSSASAPVRVPDLSPLGLLFLGLGVMLVEFLRKRRELASW